ncbi:hypothetical protein ASG37_10750 [Sphingomonas sp. Leaf407]|uniref:HPr kinase/phosphorylase n=1 Tax=unclassified Sphingomonas TaxID=196159 RepID=UPI0007016098|nr:MULTISPECIES: HPr kinase/phosphatase C-terminal domain-containing protein [unclassified Sphingomonas]KQN37512.1 hypothetical protein ASE97_08040 [Sphingomonas sp. Leaf42]KQT27880.1 hypothetical protein ASG37_10750 [Sphingomonas sp. Leaf407]
MSDADPLHATCVAVRGAGVLITGRSGSGKSDLALRLIDRGAVLVSDDYTHLRRDGDTLVATPPARIAGRIEVRGVGIVPLPHLASVPVRLLVDADYAPPRLPDTDTIVLRDVPIAHARLALREASAPLKVELLLARIIA